MSEICGLQESKCFCTEDKGHDGPHVCDCGGSWDFDADGKFVIVNLPGPFGGGRVLPTYDPSTPIAQRGGLRYQL